MSGGILVLVYLREPADAPGAVSGAYRGITWVTDPPDGLLRTKLVRDTDEPDRYLLLSEWAGMAQFRAWQTGPDHLSGARTSTLRPFQDRSRGPHYVVYQS